MYFYTNKGKQHVDFKGDLILSHNDALIKARNKSAAPRFAHNARRICNIPTLSRWGKLRATWAACRFIWGRNEALTEDNAGS